MTLSARTVTPRPWPNAACREMIHRKAIRRAIRKLFLHALLLAPTYERGLVTKVATNAKGR